MSDNFLLIVSRALSSIIVLCWPCPYLTLFTHKEWQQILEMNPYVITEQPLPPEISYSLYNACHEFVLGKDVFMEGGKSKLSRTIARFFNELYAGH